MKKLEVDVDLLFFMYTCTMGMSELSFWKSPLRKILKMIDIYEDYTTAKTAALNQESYASKYFKNDQDEPTEIHSMRELEGWS